MNIKILTCADIHLGVSTYSVIDPITGLNTRILNCLKSIDSMIDYAIKNNIKYLVMAGDAYKNNFPTPTLQDEFNKRIKRATDNGITVYLQSGNHDVSLLNTSKSPLETYKTLKIDNVYHTRYKKSYMIENKLQLLVLPTYCNQSEVEKILDEEIKGIPTLVVGHFTCIGAALNDWLIEKNESAVDCKIFNRPNILAVILGHLHKYQILNLEPLTYYTGSLQRIDFTEEKQEKGFVVLTVDTDEMLVNHEFIEIPSQKFYTIKLDLTNESDEMGFLIKEIDKKSLEIKDSIVRLILNVNKDNNIDNNIIIKKLKEYNATYIASIQKNINREDIIRNKEITESITEEKALNIYFKDHDNSEKLITAGLTMINELKDKNLI